MKKILSPNPSIEKIIGKQPEQDSIEYGLSKYVLHMPCEDGTLFLHTLSGEMFLLERQDILDDYSNELIGGWFFVPIDLDEHKQINDIRKIITLLSPQKKNITRYTIVTTTDCNARCFYCFEQGTRCITMTNQIAEDVVTYITKESCGEVVHIHWFGGEPLYNQQAIDIICEGLKRNGILFSSHITSNGYFLDNQTVQKAKHNWNVTNIQITLDGTKDIYNRTKAYIDNNEDAFLRVLNNIDITLKNDINVIMRLNLDASNADDLLDLADIIGERYSGKKGAYAIIVLLKEFAGKIHKFDSAEATVRSVQALSSKLDYYGLTYRTEWNWNPVANRCIADSDSAEVLLPDGEISKCEHCLDRGYIGSIYSEEKDYHTIKEWKKRIIAFTECYNCPLYPRCIHLEHCEWSKDGCDEATRMLLIEGFYNRMLEAYRNYKECRR